MLGCHNLNFTDTSNLYARYTTTVICNAIVQLSSNSCGSGDAAHAVCAETCADFAESETYITSDSSLCSNPGSDLTKLLRADFVTCSLPNGALSSDCIAGVDNEPNNCGYGNSTIGLCSYCGTGGINSTDTCCYNSNAEHRCKGVTLPSISATVTFTMPASTATSASATSSAAAAAANSGGHHGLSGGAIAGIVIGAVVGVALIAALLFFCIMFMKRRQGSQKGSIFNQPNPTRKSAAMSQVGSGAPQGYEVLPGGRIARMSALEGHSGDSPTHHHGGSLNNASAAAGAAFVAGKRKGGDTQSSSSDFAESEPRQGVLRPPPTTMRRNGSLSSGSALGSSVPQSPTSAAGYSSPHGVASQQSEQLPFFKDYYSQDDIHPSDRVAVLWAYQPRAPDEFALERGDMLKVVGIWDDGWATGIILDERAEEWEARRQSQRDSGVSNTSGRRDSSPAASGEIKAFPLVCVCLPEHWRKTIEGDGSTETASTGPHTHAALS